MAMTIRTGMLGLLGLWGLWGCGGTATHGDTDASDTDASDGSGDFGNGNSDGSGGNSTGGVGGNDSTSSDGSGNAATTRGSGSRNNSASSTTRGSSDDSSAAASASSGGGASSGSSSGSGSGGQVAASATSVGFTASTTVGIGGFGGHTINTVSTFGSTSVATTVSTVGSVTTTSGSSTTGTGGLPELDEFPYLEDCDASYWSFTSQYCNMGFQCPATSGWTSCWDLGNGDITCDCSREYVWGNYRLSDATMDDACAYASSACVGGPDAERGNPTCTPSSFYQSVSYCNASATCETKMRVQGADMVKVGWRYVYCYAGTDGWACDCEFDDGRLTVSLDTSSGSADMCVDAIDWCSGDITREGPRDCSPVSQYAGTNSCYVNLRCTQAAEAGGVPASVTENYTLSCGQTDDGKWVCDCPGVGNFDVEADTGWDACTLGAAECTPM